MATDQPQNECAKGARRAIDWEGVEREYRANQLSLRDIGQRFGISHTSILKRASRLQWTRDLAGQVRQRVAERLVMPESLAPEQLKRAVEDAADRAVDVIKGHRQQIATARSIVDAIFVELSDKEAPPTLTVRAAVIGSLSSAMKNLITLERQAFNMDAAEPEKPAPTEGLTAERRRAALALLLAREDPSPSAGKAR